MERGHSLPRQASLPSGRKRGQPLFLDAVVCGEETDMDDFQQAARRWLQDGECLRRSDRRGGATHAYGLAAECALKHAMDIIPGGERNLPSKHLPELVDNAKRWLHGRANSGLFQLLSRSDYMADWCIGNRYWADGQFTATAVALHRDHARRTCAATGLGI